MSAPDWRVFWRPEAETERDAARPENEVKAIYNVVEKLEAMGVGLCEPHMKPVSGSDGLWELRPRSGQSKWRPLYRRVGKSSFLILAVAPEFETNKRGFRQSVKDAEKRFEDTEE